MPNTYLALTIGPISKTLLNTSKTRELWGASYLLSRIMREVICKLLEKKIINSPDDIILPSPNLFDFSKSPATIKEKFSDLTEPNLTEDEFNVLKKLGTGLFPDRLFAKVEADKDKVIENLKYIVKEVYEELAQIINPIIFDSKKGETCLSYLEKYFQLYFILKELEDGENIIFRLSPFLDTIELQSNFSKKDEKYLIGFLNQINKSDLLIEEAFLMRYHKAHPELNIEKFGFDSIIEIAVRELGYLLNDKGQNIKQVFGQHLESFLIHHGTLKKSQKNEENEVTDRAQESKDEKDFLNALATDDTEIIIEDGKSTKKKFKDHFRTYHKYIAIVLADGDNVGKGILGEIGKDEKELKKFSRQLTEFAAKAALMIHEYGGSPVYAGGDDLLFFAPVSMVQAREPGDTRGYHILHLLQLLDKEFQKRLADYKQHNPRLSFGVSITYYAYPMGEALDQCRHLLKGVAKEVPGKNAIALAIQKHSGSQFGGVYKLNSASYQHLEKMFMHNPEEDKETELLKSVTYKFRSSDILLHHIGNDSIKVGNFMRNSFNESVHIIEDTSDPGEKKLRPYLQWVTKLVPTVYCETEEMKKELEAKDKGKDLSDIIKGKDLKEQSMQQLYGMLRTISFLKGEEI